LREVLPAGVAVVFGRAVGRADEAVAVRTLGAARSEMADMATCVIVGSRETRVVERAGRAPLVYTPRALAAAEAVR
jgi:precorrin-3B C17-methyltransferase